MADYADKADAAFEAKAARAAHFMYRSKQEELEARADHEQLVEWFEQQRRDRERQWANERYEFVPYEFHG